MVTIPKGFPKNYILVIAEKPRAAEKIAIALGNAVKYYINKVPVWVVRKNGEYYVVASAIGHMYSLHTYERGYPVFNYRWVPRYLVEVNARHIKRFLEVISMLAKNAKLYISACDYDIEGSVICYMILKHHGDEQRALRAKFSSLVRQELINAFENLSKLDYEMIEAGICRHILDWLWGINVSRALMDLYNQAFKSQRVLSAGRVQTPTLAYAIDIILQRRLFVPKPLAYPSISIEIDGKVYHVEPLDPPFTLSTEAETYIEKVKRDPYARVESVSINVVEYDPPHPFNLPDLQAEAHRILKLSPYRTQELAEDLYLEALISYPRTNSQKLPPNLNHKQILEKLSKNPVYKFLVENLLRETKGVLKPNNGSKDDPAHPAIHPTGEGDFKGLSNLHIKLYDIIVKRFLSTFAPPMKIQYINVTFDIHGRRYILKGVRIIDRGWSKYYPYISIEEKFIPINALSRGMLVPIVSAKNVIRYTKPPPLPTRMKLLKWMEEVGIGTEATRAEIIENLFRRGYIYSKSRYINVSDIAIALINILRNYVKELVSISLTRDFEEMLKEIMVKRISCKAVEEKAKNVVEVYVKNIKSNMDKIIRDLYRYIEAEDDITSLRDRCSICKRTLYKDGMCIFHYEALNRIKESYIDWQKFGFAWDKYLRKLIKLNSTGLYVRDVCRYLLNSVNTKALS
ncbi:MAG: DNA topoisomerase I [Ignisphaera sp.]